MQQTVTIQCRNHFGTGMLKWMHVKVGHADVWQQDRSTSFLSLARTEGNGIGVAEMCTASSDFREGKIIFLAKDLVAST